MKKNTSIFIIIACMSLLASQAQTDTSGLPSDLEKMFFRLRENRPASEKLLINDSITALIDSYSASDSVFNHRFENLRFLGQLTSPDSLVKLITWNLILDDGQNRYACNIVRRKAVDQKSDIFRLRGSHLDRPPDTDTIYRQDGWYGALYYDLRPFAVSNQTYYAILGIDYGNSFITRKIIDVLRFDPDDLPAFGLKCFSDGSSLKHRIVFEYSSKAVMSLRFESDNLIVFDHLSPFTPDLKGDRQFYGPDFSFDSYRFEKDIWRLREDIDIKNK